MFLDAKCIFCRSDIPVNHYARIILDVGSQYSYICHWECLEKLEENYVVDYAHCKSVTLGGTCNATDDL